MRLTMALLLMTVAGTAVADGFIAVCEADGVTAYRHSTDMSGKDMGAEWSRGEKFPGKFRFNFDGQKMEIDGKQAAVMYWNGVLLVALDGGDSDAAVSLWSYAFNLDLEEVVGTQVNAFRTIGTGIKARVANFTCDFTYQ